MAERREEWAGSFAANVQDIWLSDEEVILQGLPSTVTELLAATAANPVPVMVRSCPPKFPFKGETVVMVGKTENSKLSSGLSEALRSPSARRANPGVTFCETKYFPATCWLDATHWMYWGLF